MNTLVCESPRECCQGRKRWAGLDARVEFGAAHDIVGEEIVARDKLARGWRRCIGLGGTRAAEAWAIKLDNLCRLAPSPPQPALRSLVLFPSLHSCAGHPTRSFRVLLRPSAHPPPCPSPPPPFHRTSRLCTARGAPHMAAFAVNLPTPPSLHPSSFPSRVHALLREMSHSSSSVLQPSCRQVSV